MTIEVIKGNMFDLNVDAYVNDTNCEGIMGAGIALTFRKKYPEMFQDYKRACKNKEHKSGKCHIWKQVDTFSSNIRNEYYIINFPSTPKLRVPTKDYDIKNGMIDLHNIIKDYEIKSICIPALGCVYGKYDFEKLKNYVFEYLSSCDCKIYLFEP